MDAGKQNRFPNIAENNVEPVGDESPNDLLVLPPGALSDLLGEFVTESREYLQGAEVALLALEAEPDNEEAINTVFRAFHTIKGTSAFLDLPWIKELAHKSESLFSRMRDREIRCTGGFADLALQSVDMLKALLQGVQDAMNGQRIARPAGYGQMIAILSNPAAAGISEASDEKSPEPLRLGDVLVAQGKVSRAEIERVAASQGARPLGEALIRSHSVSGTDVVKALRALQADSGAGHTADSSVRVRTDRLDRLIDMVGELVIAHSMIAQDGTLLHSGHQELAHKVGHAGKIVREFQDLCMSMRMVPLKGTFQKMNRLVRDLSVKSGKQVDLLTHGDDTEIDRNIVDIIGDPLVHMVRNAVDHGIEAPETRERNGKPKTGTIRLSAYHAGGNVVIELADDGKGLDRDKIIQKAVSRGLIESDRALSDSEVFNLIFAPGFSTAENVTDVSGRGVGMDVVKRNVEALRGRIHITSEPGFGCKFSIHVPLTLAITDGMLVKVGSDRYIIPTINIHSMFRPEAASLSTVVERGEMVLLRGQLMPIVRLHREFHVMDAVEDPTQGLLLVVGEGNRRCALLVDELQGQQQVVAKSLGEAVGKIKGVSGAAILGDGRVRLILDTPEIVALGPQTESKADDTFEMALATR